LRSCQRSVEAWKDWICLKKELAKLGNTWCRAASSAIVTTQAPKTESGSNKDGRKQRGVRPKTHFFPDLRPPQVDISRFFVHPRFSQFAKFCAVSPQFSPFFPLATAVSRAKPPLATVVSCDGSGTKPIITDQLTERTEALTTRTGFGETADTTSSS